MLEALRSLPLLLVAAGREGERAGAAWVGVKCFMGSCGAVCHALHTHKLGGYRVEGLRGICTGERMGSGVDEA